MRYYLTLGEVIFDEIVAETQKYCNPVQKMLISIKKLQLFDLDIFDKLETRPLSCLII